MQITALLLCKGSLVSCLMPSGWNRYPLPPSSLGRMDGVGSLSSAAKTLSPLSHLLELADVGMNFGFYSEMVWYKCEIQVCDALFCLLVCLTATTWEFVCACYRHNMMMEEYSLVNKDFTLKKTLKCDKSTLMYRHLGLLFLQKHDLAVQA